MWYLYFYHFKCIYSHKRDINSNWIRFLLKVITRMLRHPKFSIGGAERQMEMIGSELVQKKVDFHYIADKFALRGYKYQKKLEIVNGIKVHFIGFYSNRVFHNLWDGFLSVAHTLDFYLFIKNFRKFDSDIYHLRGATNVTGSWAFFAKIIKRKKFVFTTANIRNCIPKSYPWNKGMYRIYEYGLKRADVVVVLAEYMKKALYQNYGINSVVIKSGHPVPKGRFKKDDPPMILWIARPYDLKRPELFLQIAQDLIDLKTQFIYIGPGEYMKKEFMAFAKKQKNFTYIYSVPRGEDNEYYERASLLVNTSRPTGEGYPNTFIQAWLHETPVMSLDVDPDCDICKNGLGFHAKGDINAMIDKIKEFIENPSILKETSNRCREYAVKNHNIKKTAEQYYRLYKWLLEKK